MVGSVLSGRTVVVTGAAHGIGRATAEHLAGLGARVALADIDGEQAARRASRLSGSRAYRVDVADRESFRGLVDAVTAELGPPDVLVNNAAVMALGPFRELSPRAARRQIAVNFEGVLHGMQLVLPAMIERGGGHIINVSSAAGRWGVPGESVYAATKHAVVGLTEALRRELRSSGVRASLVFMGPVSRTALSAGMKPTRAIRLVTPESVAATIGRLVVTPRPEVWIPRSLGWMHATGQMLPRRLRERLEDAAGLGRIATDIDRPARAAYERNAFPSDRAVGTR